MAVTHAGRRLGHSPQIAEVSDALSGSPLRPEHAQSIGSFCPHRRYVIGEHRFSPHSAVSQEFEAASWTNSRFAPDEKVPTTRWALWFRSDSARAQVVHSDRAAAERLRRDQF
jgi:hypothetical protein